MCSNFEPKIEWRDPRSLKPYEHNNKQHPPAKVEKLAQAIAEFGFDQPIAITLDGGIIKGHARHEAALHPLLSLKKVPVVVRTDLSAAQIKAARIADNQASEGSEYDYDAIAIDLRELESLDFDLELTGLEDWAELLDSSTLVEADDPDVADTKRRLGNKAKQIKPVLYLEQVKVFEQALRLTGNANRGEAFAQVCQFYVDQYGEAEATEGQLDTL